MKMPSDKPQLMIGLYGSADPHEEERVYQYARTLGALIASDGHIIVTGACQGIPFEAAKEARSCGGKSIGFTAATSRETHESMMGTSPNDYDDLQYIPEDYPYRHSPTICKKYRNVSSVAACDIALFISGRWGTLNEFSIAYDTEKIMGVLTGVGKFSTQVHSLMTLFNKSSNASVVYHDQPDKLYQEVIQLAAARSHP